MKLTKMLCEIVEQVVTLEGAQRVLNDLGAIDAGFDNHDALIKHIKGPHDAGVVKSLPTITFDAEAKTATVVFGCVAFDSIGEETQVCFHIDRHGNVSA